MANTLGITPETIEMAFDKFIVNGFTAINNWGGGSGVVKMQEFSIDPNGLKDFDEMKEIIKSLLNDGGYGCESIIGGYVHIWAYYTNKDCILDKTKMGQTVYAKRYVDSIFVEKDGKLTEDYKDLLLDVDSY
jgi:hypothetical protein